MSRATSCADRLAVGSSMISTLTDRLSARAISTVCCSASVNPLAARLTSMLTPSCAISASASWYISDQRMKAPLVRLEMKMFSATFRSGNTIGS